MKCDVAIERLLEADPAELRGRGGTELARHVAGCDRCGRIAATLLAELAVVDEALAAYAASGDADAAAEHALASSAKDRGSRIERPTLEGGRSGTAAGRRRGLSRYIRIGVPLAAAAVLATLLLPGRDVPPAPGSETTTGAAPLGAVTPPRVAVTPPADRGVAVMETENPKITVVWLYEREES